MRDPELNVFMANQPLPPQVGADCEISTVARKRALIRPEGE